MRNQRGFLIAICLVIVAALGCTKKAATDPIVIPPGDLVVYSNSDFLPYSKAFYSIDFQRYDAASKSFFSIEDLTPADEKDIEKVIQHIVPKDKNAPGTYRLKVNLPRVGMSFTSFVLAGRTNMPGIVSTLIVDLVSAYPDTNLETVSAASIVRLENAAQESIDRINAEYELGPDDLEIRQRIKFIKNYLCRDSKFLSVAKEEGFKFSVNSDGAVDSAPYPFDNNNTLPKLDVANSTSLLRNVTARETEDLTLKGRLLDSENDAILYRWYLDGKFYSKEAMQVKWTPGFFDSRVQPYKFKLVGTDGGLPIVFEWTVDVLDRNRSPELLSTCPATGKEGDLWSCTLKAVDYDGDPISFSISDRTTNARVKVNGVETDNTTRVAVVPGATEVTLEITPNNLDAKKRSVYFEVTLEDGKGGRSILPINVVVEDINQPPQVVYVAGSPLQPMSGSPLVPHEWDYCANEDPDGGQAYRFMIEVKDPDNQSSAGPRAAEPDVVDFNYAGTLKDSLTVLGVVDGCPISTPLSSYFCFEWKPHNLPRTGTITLTLKDDHGGLSQIPSPDNPTPITLTSQDRNVRPCLKAQAVNKVLSDGFSSFTDSLSGEDADETSPWPELVNVPTEVLPLLKTTTGDYLIFKRTFSNPTEWVNRFPNAGVGVSTAQYNIFLKSPVSGMVQLSRAAPHTSDITISQGTVFKTSTLPRIQYEAAQDVVMSMNDKDILIPVRAINRTVAVGKLNRFITAPSFSVNVSNLTALSTSGQVQLSRASAPADGFLPAGTEIGTSEVADGTETIRFETVDNVTMKAGVLSLNIRVTRKLVKAPVGSVTVTTGSWAGPALTISNPVELTDVQNYTLARDLNLGVTTGTDRFCWNRRVSDSGVVPANEVFTSMSAVPAGLVFNGVGALEDDGQLKVSRTDTSGTQTINAGIVFRSTDGTRMVNQQNVTLPVGQAVAYLNVTRTNNKNPAATPAGAETICMGWSDTNYEPSFLNSGNVKVNQDQALIDYEMSVTDNRNDPLTPNDYLDRHTFTVTPVGTPPSGAYKACREPGTDPNDINQPACTPCTTGASTYFESASCFFRFKPLLADVSQTFTFKIEADDHGLNFPPNTNVRNQFLNVTVVENNVPPTFTDSSWNALANVDTDHAYYLGEFVEGTQSIYRIYLTDSNRGTDLKNQIAPTVVRTWQFVSPTGWVVRTNPSSFIAELSAPSVYDVSGVGSQTVEQFRWAPTDEDAKRFSGPGGFVIETRACDVGSVDSPRQCRTGFYKMTVRNINNLPSVVTNISNLSVQADKFVDTAFVIKDIDYASNSTFPNTQSSFYTQLSMCPTAGVYNCDADQTGWPVVLSTYDSPYAGNSSVTQCQTAGVLSNYKLPKFELQTPTTGTVTGTVKERDFNYRFRWCPQKSHIGKQLVYFNITDNGDEDIRGPTSKLAAQRVQIPVNLNVVAPVFFTSPKKSPSTIDAVSWMKQAFSLTEYRYEILINNSRGNLVTLAMPVRAKVTAGTVGNPTLETRPYSNPTTVTTSSTTQITNLNLTTHRVFLVWRPYGATTTTNYVSDPADQTTWPQFQLKVTDQTLTSENETVQFRVQVKDPLTPFNTAPVISSVFPASATLTIPEQIAQSFSVTATDTNGDYLHYKWFVDGVLKSDVGSSFSYLPAMDDAFLPTATPGVHTIIAQVSDGQERATPTQNTWTVTVRNTTPLPTRLYYTGTTTLWTMAQSVVERGFTGGISNLNWGPTLGVATKSGTTTNNHLLFTGSYTRASVTRHFAWRLQFTKTVFNDSVASSGNQATELLPWTSGRQSEQLAFTQDPGNLLQILVGSVPTPEGSFSSTSDAVKLSPSLSSITSIAPGNACTGTCAQGFFRNLTGSPSTTPLADTVLSAGRTPSAAYSVSGNVYYFFSADNGATLKWNRFGSPVVVLAALPGNDRIGDIAVNSVTKRLYVTVRDPALSRNFIHVYDLSSVTSDSVPFVTQLTIFDGVTADNRVLDLAVDSEKNRVYALLPGTGGVAKLTDDGLSVPNAGSVQYIGVNQISSSYSDAVGAGRKLVFNPASQLLYGIARDANEIFVIDTLNDAFTVRVFRADQPLDEVVTFASDGLTLAIQRSLGWVYLIK